MSVSLEVLEHSLVPKSHLAGHPLNERDDLAERPGAVSHHVLVADELHGELGVEESRHFGGPDLGGDVHKLEVLGVVPVDHIAW